MATKDPIGVTFPMSSNARSSTAACKLVLAAALQAANNNTATQLSEKLQREKNWRFGYGPYIVGTVNEMCDSDRLNAIATAGLDSARAAFEYHSKDQPHCSMAEASTQPTQHPFHTGIITGQGSLAGGIDVPYAGKSFPLCASNQSAMTLSEVVKQWVRDGTAEPSLYDSVCEVIDNPQWLNLNGHTFALLGATSEMGPLEHLLNCGATVVAIARPSKGKKWESLLHQARISPGKLVFPMTAKFDPSADLTATAALCGADACTQVAELSQWLTSAEMGQAIGDVHPLKIYSGIYLNGEGFVRASLAMDAIVDACVKHYTARRPTLLYIDTPSAAHVVPDEIKHGSRKFMGKSSMFQRMLSKVNLLAPNKFEDITKDQQHGRGNVDGISDRFILDGMATQQGPNYAMAKLMQRWRAILSRAAGCVVSVTTGPGAKTDSVMHSPTMAMLMNNMHLVPPNVAMEPETVQALMTAIMIRDMHSERAFANPKVQLKHGMDLFWENAWHGGAWRSPYDMKSVGTYIFMRHYSMRYAFPALVVLAMYYFLV